MQDGMVRTIRVFNAQAIAGSGNATSGIIDLNVYRPINWKFSAQITSAGADSTIKLEYLLSVDGGLTYAEPVGATDIVAAHAVGTNIYPFAAGEPAVATHMKLKATENTGNAVSSMTVYLCMQ